MKRGVAAPERGHAFISYVREDKRRVDHLEQVLESDGIPVWRDTHDLWPGEDWRKKIRDAIAADSLAFIVCFSTYSEARQKSYQRDELLLAIEQLRLRSTDRPYLLTVRFDNCPIPELPIGAGRTLDSLQWVDLFGRHRQENERRLAEGVKRILSQQPTDRRGYRGARKTPSDREGTTGEQDPGEHAGLVRRPIRHRLRAALFAALAVAALGTGLGFWLHRGSPPGVPPPPPGMRVTDNTGDVSIVVPKAWGDVLGDGWHPPGRPFNGALIGPGLNAAPNVNHWFNDLTTPGLFAGASKLLITDHYTPETILPVMGSPCNFSFRQPISTHGLAGYRVVWTCSKSATRYWTIALWPKNHTFIAFIELKIVTSADEASGNRAVASFTIRRY
jgi:TIR domain